MLLHAHRCVHVYVTRETLKQRYSDLVDDELLRRLRSGVLTELAREVALEEVAARGLSLEAAPPEASTAIDPELEFAEDEFESNPYQAPRLPAGALTTVSTPAATPLRRRIADLLWFGYALLSALLVVAMVVSTLWRRDFAQAFHPSVALMTMAIVGLFAWRLRRALLHPWLWVACFAANLALLAIAWKDYVAFIENSGHLGTLPIAMTGVFLQFPLYWGLARYAFGSRAICSGRTALRADPGKA